MAKRELGYSNPSTWKPSCPSTSATATFPKIVELLSQQGIPLDKPFRGSPEKGYSATLRDPDGYVIFLDASPDEVER